MSLELFSTYIAMILCVYLLNCTRQVANYIRAWFVHMYMLMSVFAFSWTLKMHIKFSHSVLKGTRIIAS